jgi:hypothetical protein
MAEVEGRVFRYVIESYLAGAGSDSQWADKAERNEDLRKKSVSVRQISWLL